MAEEKPAEKPPETKPPVDDDPKTIHQKAQEKQKEGEKKEEQHPPEGSPRWNEIYWKAKEFDRQQDKVQKLETGFNALQEHNKQLEQAIKKIDAAPTEKKKERTAEQVLNELRGSKKAAMDELDYAKALSIQDQIDDVMLYVIQHTKTKPEEVKKIAKETTKETALEDEIQASITDFATRNEWFVEKLPDGSDNPKFDIVKHGTAVALEQRMLKAWKGSYRELLKEVQKQVDEKFKGNGSAQKVPGVARTDTPAGDEKFELTGDQKRVAGNMFPSLTQEEAEKKYLGQLTAIRKSRGGK